VRARAAARIVTRAPGYVVETSADELDALRFETLTQQVGAAVRAGRWPEAAQTAREAARLWRGTPLADIPSQLLRDRWVPQAGTCELEGLRVSLATVTEKLQSLDARTARQPAVTDLGMPAFTRSASASGAQPDSKDEAP
jgi:hypothetical protein